MNHNHCSQIKRPHPRIFIMKFAGSVVSIGLFSLIFGWLAMVLWNWLMPMLFGLKSITYWQAFGLLILSKLLFSGIGGHHRHHGPHWGHHLHHRRGNFRQYWKEQGEDDFNAYLKRTGHLHDDNHTDEPEQN